MLARDQDRQAKGIGAFHHNYKDHRCPLRTCDNSIDGVIPKLLEYIRIGSENDIPHELGKVRFDRMGCDDRIFLRLEGKM
jgi:hypothetical protein